MKTSKFVVLIGIILLSSCSLEKSNIRSKVIEKRHYMAGFHINGFKSRTSQNRSMPLHKETSTVNSSLKEISIQSRNPQEMDKPYDIVGIERNSTLELPAMSYDQNNVSTLLAQIPEESKEMKFLYMRQGYTYQSTCQTSTDFSADSARQNSRLDSLKYQKKATKNISKAEHERIIKKKKRNRVLFAVLGVCLSVASLFFLATIFPLILVPLAIVSFIIARSQKLKLKAQQRQMFVEHSSNDELLAMKESCLKKLNKAHKVSNLTGKLVKLLPLSIPLAIPVFILFWVGYVVFGSILLVIMIGGFLIGLVSSIVNIVSKKMIKQDLRMAEMISIKLGQQLPEYTKSISSENKKNRGLIALLIGFGVLALTILSFAI